MSANSQSKSRGASMRDLFRSGAAVESRLSLPGLDEAEIWSADLSVTAAEAEKWRSVLSQEERQRADRFRFDDDRRRFVVAKGILRTLLGDYLCQSPSEIRFRTGRLGKPELKAAVPLEFNVSHCRDVALFGFARGGAIGVDVECFDRQVELEDVAGKTFTGLERQSLDALEGEERTRGFFKGWTCKEAVAKAVGEGLSFSFDRIEVSVDPNRPAKLISIDGECELAKRWTIKTFSPKPGYIASIALMDPGRKTKIREWTHV